MKVLDFAMEMDLSGRDFYRRMARRTSDQGARRIFERMAMEEERMVDSYRRMLKSGRPELVAESMLLELQENPFRQPAPRAVAQDELEAYRMTLEMERKVCNLLAAAAHQEADPPARRMLKEVAAKECHELEEMENLYSFVNAPNEYLAWGEFSNLDEFHNFGRYEDNRACRHTG